MRRPTVSCVLFAALSLLPLTTSQAQQPIHTLQHALLGNSTEDIAFVASGPLAGNIAVMDGYEVRGVPTKHHPARALFDVLQLGIEFAPRGITYIDSSGLFAFDDGIQMTKFFLADGHGRPKGARTIQYLNNFLPNWLEGLSYIPKNAKSFPDHILLSAVIFNPQESRIEVLQKSGKVEAEILPAEPLRSSYITGVSYLSSNRILIADITDLWEIDFSGNIVAGPVSIDGTGDIEGVAQLGNGDIVAADHDTGMIYFFDKNLNRLQRKDRSYRVGIGVSVPIGVAWNNDTNRHLVMHAPASPVQPTEIVSVLPNLLGATRVVDLSQFGLTGGDLSYLPDEHLIAMLNRNSPRAIVLFDNSGNPVEQIDLSAFGAPLALAYIPTSKQFALGCRNDLVLHILDRTGNLVRNIDLSSMNISGIGGLAFFDPTDRSGGKFLMIVNDATHTTKQLAIVTDFNGNLRRKFGVRKTFGLLAIADISPITSGKQKGAFSLVNSENSQISIFSLR